MKLTLPLLRLALSTPPHTVQLWGWAAAAAAAAAAGVLIRPSSGSHPQVRSPRIHSWRFMEWEVFSRGSQQTLCVPGRCSSFNSAGHESAPRLRWSTSEEWELQRAASWPQPTCVQLNCTDVQRASPRSTVDPVVWVELSLEGSSSRIQLNKQHNLQDDRVCVYSLLSWICCVSQIMMGLKHRVRLTFCLPRSCFSPNTCMFLSGTKHYFYCWQRTVFSLFYIFVTYLHHA